ncbi:MAG: histidinol-phosphatase HisJ family protein [Butyricicoccaceae bacterium]
MLMDLHLHSRYSFDAAPEDGVEQHTLAAIRKGLDQIGFTDHIDFFPNPADDIISDVDAVRHEVLECRERYGDQIEIFSSVEIGQMHLDPRRTHDFLEAHEFDYVIGSIHNSKDGTDIYYIPFDKVDHDAFLQEYFDEMQAMIDFGHFDILAHIDFPLRVMKQPDNHPSFAGYLDRIEPILQSIIRKDIALESNAKGLLTWQKQVGPEDFVLKLYRELGGELITVGSDSHAAKTIGAGIPEALERLKSLGFQTVTTFRDHHPVQVAL